ncbi:hypothetical protein ILUMI_04554 [Ignelater luminosus]|uniref:Uncharacterized protein n=1 Tax=Ignelater luminosus TaxID=2038154 RepID=A0A8K0D9G5_IGNLU|nr:hypothetical protein ILUMI_04554 [Ignelater luminosus]
MRFTVAALLVGLCALALATPVVEEQGIQGGYHQYKLHDKDYLTQYKDVLTLFKYVHQRTYYKYHVDIAKDYSIEHNLNGYTVSLHFYRFLLEFLHYYREGMLPRDEVFSVFYDYHLKQAVALFKVLYYAKDFDTFYKTACWARYYLNQGMFLYSFSVALIHRYDTYTMVLPPIYEIYPYYFFNTEVIQKAQYYKQLWTGTGVQQPHGYVIHANYSGWYLNLHPEQSMSYFTEDIGVNAYYYYYNLYRPFWMNTEEYGIKTYQRGEEFYYFYQQLVARYYLERLSNDFGEIGTYDYNAQFETGYYPSLRYPNGLAFPERSNWVYFFTNYYNHGQSYSLKGQYPYSYYKVLDYERRIRDAIDAGFVYGEEGQKINLFEPHGFNTLGNIIESNPDSPNTRFYGYLQVFARHLLGYSYQPLHEYKIAPSALEHFETSLRDPAFWMFYKRIILYFQKYKYHLSHYTYDDLIYAGVKVEGIQVDPLVTYFEQYDVDLTNAVYMNEQEWQHNTFEVYARQWRLNHKPFAYKINVVSEKPTQAVVRVFIGPKYDEYGRYIHIDENRLNFVEFDKFKYELKAGQNVIERNSHQIFYAADRTTYKHLYQWVMSGVHGDDFVTHGSELYYAFPNRFLLPKGKIGGQVYQFYVIVSPYKPVGNWGHQHQNYLQHYHQKYPQHHEVYQKLHAGQDYGFWQYPMVGLGVQYLDDYPLGYPFDKPISTYSFYVPNSYFQDVVIYHKHTGDINTSAYHGDTYHHVEDTYHHGGDSYEQGVGTYGTYQHGDSTYHHGDSTYHHGDSTYHHVY